jgi:hypothetical protein
MPYIPMNSVNFSIKSRRVGPCPVNRLICLSTITARDVVSKNISHLVSNQNQTNVILILDWADLLNHDDVIGTRRVSYILYLTDPDTPWQAADGGSLELYPVDSETRQPLPIPSGKILPSWNHFVFFTVQPGKSFHSVEEVFNLKKSRLSISGWFHLPHQDEPGYLEGLCIKEEEEKELKSLGASLDQLVSI